MTATRTYHFGAYTLRPADIDDLPLAAEWTEADPHHRDKTSPDFWLKQDWRSDSYVLSDGAGPVYFARVIIVTAPNDPRPAVEMHIQFPPEPESKSQQYSLHSRTSIGLVRGLAWLEKMLRNLKVREIYFESRSQPLIEFAARKLGFRQAGNRLAKQL